MATSIQGAADRAYYNTRQTLVASGLSMAEAEARAQAARQKVLQSGTLQEANQANIAALQSAQQTWQQSAVAANAPAALLGDKAAISTASQLVSGGTSGATMAQPHSATAGTMTNTAVGQSTGTVIDPGQYLRANPELVAAFATQDPRYIPEQYRGNLAAFATWHYNNYGQKEGRATAPAEGVTDDQIEQQFRAALQGMQSGASQYKFNAPDVAAFGGISSDLTPEQEAQLKAMQSQTGDGAATPQDIEALRRRFISENQSSGIGFGGTAYTQAGDGGTEYQDPFATLPSQTRNAALQYAQKNPNATPYEVLKGIGLSDQDIGYLQANNNINYSFGAKDEAAISALTSQLNPEAFAKIAEQSRMKPEEITRQMAGDLARYGINDLQQLGSYKTPTGDVVFFNKATGALLPATFGSDMTGKGGKDFELVATEGGGAVPVPKWVDTSQKDEAVGALSVLAIPVGGYAAGYLGGGVQGAGALSTQGLGYSGMTTGAIVGGGTGAAIGGVDGIQGAVKGGLTGAAIGGVAGAASDYMNNTGVFAPDGTTSAPVAGSSGVGSPDYSLGSGSGGETGLTGRLADNGYGFQGIANGGQGLTTSAAPNLGSMGGGTGLLGLSTSGQVVNAGGVVGSNPGIRTNLTNDPANTTAASAGGGSPSTGGSSPAGNNSMSDWLKTLGTAAASPIGKAAIGSVVAGALAPDAPDAPNLGTGGTGTGTSGNTQSLLDQQQAVSQEYLDWLKSENEWLKPYIQNQLDTGKQASSLQLDAAGKLSGMADTMWQDYQTKFRPVEDKMISDAMNYDSEGAQAKAAARATGEIDKQLSNSRQETAARMASMGIDPSSGRYASAAGTQDLYAAAQKASAATSARDTVKNTGITLRQSAANFGADKAKTSGTLTGLGASAAGAAATTAGAGISSGTQAASLPGSGYTSVINSIGNKVNQANTDSKNALTLYDARMRNYQDELQGIGSLVGAALDTFGYYSTRP